MIEFTVNSTEAGKTLIDVILSRYPSVPPGRLLRAFRERDVKVNGQRVSDAKMRLPEGCNVKAYVDAAADPGNNGKHAGILLPGEGSGRQAQAAGDRSAYTVFENDHIIIAAKPQGILSEPDVNRPSEPAFSSMFSEEGAELCHRLDRNTGGLLIFSKKSGFTEGIKQAVNARRYNKIYAARVTGDAEKVIASGGAALPGGWRVFRAWHRKDPEGKLVTVSDRRLPGSKEIETRIRFIGGARQGGLAVSDVEVMLITGRTHQIRAHLAHLGIPVAGDGKYGSEALRRRSGLQYQALWATRLEPSADYSGPLSLVPASWQDGRGGNDGSPSGAACASGREGAAVPIAQILPERIFESLPDYR